MLFISLPMPLKLSTRRTLLLKLNRKRIKIHECYKDVNEHHGQTREKNIIIFSESDWYVVVKELVLKNEFLDTLIRVFFEFGMCQHQNWSTSRYDEYFTKCVTFFFTCHHSYIIFEKWSKKFWFKFRLYLAPSLILMQSHKKKKNTFIAESV